MSIARFNGGCKMKVTHELMQALVRAGCFPPRHQSGCPKNFARMMPLILAGQGKSIEEIKSETFKLYEAYDCKCEEL